MSDQDLKKPEKSDDFKVSEYSSQISVRELSQMFSRAFPQRDPIFFSHALKKVDSVNSKIFLLLVNGKIHGATFAYRIHTESINDLWAPSYWYVEEKYRSYSLSFFISFKSALGGRLVDISPNDPVKKLLTAMRFKEINHGSLMIPIPFSALLKKSKNRVGLNAIVSPIERFKNRHDLLWFNVNCLGQNSDVCIKKSSRFGISFLILVYFQKDTLDILLPILAKKLLHLKPFSILLFPNLSKTKKKFPYFLSNKFHSFSNYIETKSIYSVLGSEVTEII